MTNRHCFVCFCKKEIIQDCICPTIDNPTTNYLRFSADTFQFGCSYEIEVSVVDGSDVEAFTSFSLEIYELGIT